MAIDPIRPQDIASAKQSAFPDDVIDCWNRLIAVKFSGRSARVTQNEAVIALCARTGQQRHEVFDRGWLDVEPIYRAVGWQVSYTKPSSEEEFEAYFVFSSSAPA